MTIVVINRIRISTVLVIYIGVSLCISIIKITYDFPRSLLCILPFKLSVNDYLMCA